MNEESPRIDRCETCAFRQADTRPDYLKHGWCRRNPPVLTITADAVGDVTYHQEWPWMQPNDWCGEWRSKITFDAINRRAVA